MNRWFKGLAVLSLASALVVIVPLISNTPRVNGEAVGQTEVVSKQIDPVAAVVPSTRPLYKDEKEWKTVVTKHYQCLADLLKNKDWGGISELYELYGPDVVVYSAEERTRFRGGHEISFHFWQKKIETKLWKNIEFEIEEIKILPVDIPVQIKGKSERFNQLVFIGGKFKMEASPANSSRYEACWGHIGSCPDFLLSENIYKGI